MCSCVQVALNVSGAGPRHPPLAGEVLAQAKAHVAAWRVAEAIKAATAKVSLPPLFK